MYASIVYENSFELINQITLNPWLRCEDSMKDNWKLNDYNIPYGVKLEPEYKNIYVGSHNMQLPKYIFTNTQDFKLYNLMIRKDKEMHVDRLQFTVKIKPCFKDSFIMGFTNQSLKSMVANSNTNIKYIQLQYNGKKTVEELPNPIFYYSISYNEEEESPCFNFSEFSITRKLFSRTLLNYKLISLTETCKNVINCNIKSPEEIIKLEIPLLIKKILMDKNDNCYEKRKEY